MTQRLRVVGSQGSLMRVGSKGRPDLIDELLSPILLMKLMLVLEEGGTILRQVVIILTLIDGFVVL